MRDLQKDLEWVKTGDDTSCHAHTMEEVATKALEIAEHALERAIKAEALNRELVEALESVSAQLSNTLEVPIPPHIQQLIAKVKEVLGSE